MLGRTRSPFLALVVATALIAGCTTTKAKPLVVPPSVEASGGATSVFDDTLNAFGHAAPNLSDEDKQAFAVGNSIFNDNWVAAPASAEGRDGLGPTFNALSCSGCHFKDGRSQPPADPTDTEDAGLLFRLSVPGDDGAGGPKPDPTYGGQLNPRAIPNVPAEGYVEVTRAVIDGTYADGTHYSLERPTYRFVGALGPASPGLMLSPRTAPAMIGLGLLEAVPTSVIEAAADPNDANKDGISGRTNMIVVDPATGAKALGRFGWKAAVPTVRDQAAGAFAGDIGITSSLHPNNDCPAPQTACAAAPSGGNPELDPHKLDRVVFYSRTLAVPSRRGLDQPAVGAGAVVFAKAGCGSCHTATQHTGASDIAAVADQEIHPYTDLLLHDMGPELADDRPDHEATGTEWRTAPLWGIGLVKVVNGHTRFLHDGRARDLDEAILWHGGEGQASRDSFEKLPAKDRASLLSFLRSL